MVGLLGWVGWLWFARKLSFVRGGVVRFFCCRCCLVAVSVWVSGFLGLLHLECFLVLVSRNFNCVAVA